MELTKTKFKQTEVGSIPNDWKLSSILEVCRHIFLGLTSKVDYVDNGGYPLIRATDIAKGKLDFSNVRTISEEQHKKITRYKISKRGDLLVSKSGSLGVCALVDSDIKFTTYESIITISPKDKLNSNYLLWLMRDERTQERMIGGKVGSSVSHLNIKMFRELQVPLPSLPEQKAIAQVLSDTDNLIQAIEQKLAKKRAIKQGAMQRLLTPKKGWEVKKLGTISHFYNGKAHEQFIDANGNYKVINSKFVSTGGTVFKSANVNICPLKKGDITMVMSDIPNGKALAKCFLVPADDKYTLNQRICAIRTEEVDTEFLYFILNRNKYYLAFDSGTGQTNLKKNDVLECPIPLPKTQEEQTEIATILIDMNKEIAQLEQKLSKYKMLKQGLMQNLLTGKIRLI